MKELQEQKIYKKKRHVNVLKVVITNAIIFKVCNIFLIYQKNSWVHPLVLKHICLC